MTFSHFGDELYSKEELCAELGAAFLCGHAGMDPSNLPNSAAYLASWLRVLKGDKKLIVQAAAQAQRATEHVLGVSYVEQASEQEQVAKAA